MMQKKTKLLLMVLGFIAFYTLPTYLPIAGNESNNPLINALYLLQDYTRLHILTCLVPAFFIAGAIASLVPKERITQYLGKNVPKRKAYPLSVVAGFVLAVCSCTVLPLFAGIKKKGAGLGPAIAFLYTAPAINIMAVVFTGGVLGWDLAFARAILSMIFAVLTGALLEYIFRAKDKRALEDITPIKEATHPHKAIKDPVTLLMLSLFMTLIIGTCGLGALEKSLALSVLILFIIAQLKLRFSGREIRSWLAETYFFTEKIFPLLLIGVFFAGFIQPIIPDNFLGKYVGGNSIASNFLAVLFGVVMYFPTLVEVPMAQLFLEQGMGKGPLLAYLLADPVLSLPSIIVVRGLIGNKKTLAYVLLVTVFCTLAGIIYGALG